MPVEDASVYCEACGDNGGHTFAYSDAQGFYAFSEVAAGPARLLISKEGYDVIDQRPYFGYSSLVATVDGDTRFDIQLVRR